MASKRPDRQESHQEREERLYQEAKAIFNALIGQMRRIREIESLNPEALREASQLYLQAAKPEGVSVEKLERYKVYHWLIGSSIPEEADLLDTEPSLLDHARRVVAKMCQIGYVPGCKPAVHTSKRNRDPFWNNIANILPAYREAKQVRAKIRDALDVLLDARKIGLDEINRILDAVESPPFLPSIKNRKRYVTYRGIKRMPLDGRTKIDLSNGEIMANAHRVLAEVQALMDQHGLTPDEEPQAEQVLEGTKEEVQYKKRF